MKDIQSFLKKINIHPDQTDIDQTAESIMDEMKKGLEGENSSLRMLETYLSAEGSAPENTPVIAIDAGGTNLRTGLVSFKNGAPVLSNFSKTPVPGSEGEVSADEFFSALADKVLPLTEKSDIIGFCFSYPAEILPNRDGRIIQLNKELRVSGAQGAVIGESLIKKLRERGALKPFRFTLLNDTTASLMGGLAGGSISSCDGLAGLILGTGFNTCYLERGEKIKKLQNADNMIINCESGCFSLPFRGEPDRLTDAESAIGGDHLLEKMLSGAYMGQLASNTARLAEREGLLSDAFSNFAPFTAMELDDFLRGADNRISKMCSGDDRENLSAIIDALNERSARLVCANIQALCLWCDGGKSPDSPFCVVAEGSTFYNSLLFRTKLEALLKSHLEKTHGRYAVCLRAEDATMTGTALAALLN